MRGSTAGTFPIIPIRSSVIICAVFLALGAGGAADETTSPVLQAMRAELERSMQKLKTEPVPPYFLSYEITETHAFNVSGAFGKLTGSHESRRRQLDIDLRVGDYSMDNTREIRGAMGGNPYANYANITVPPPRNLLVRIQARAPNHPPPAIEIDVPSETMSPPSEARCE
jgi:hypothetical protein